MSTKTALSVWENEAGQFVIFGTHNIERAATAAKSLLDPDDEHSSITVLLREHGEALWASPEVDIEREYWPEGWVSHEEQPGWTPFLAATL